MSLDWSRAWGGETTDDSFKDVVVTDDGGHVFVVGCTETFAATRSLIFLKFAANGE